MKILQAYVPELISGIITLIFGIIFLISRPNESDGYIVLAVGAQLTVALFLLKSEIINKFDDKINLLEIKFDEKTNRLELFELLEKIRPELQDRAARSLRECKSSLQELSRGIITDNASVIFNMLSEYVNYSKYEVLAVHVGKTSANFEVWRRDYMQNYFECKKRAIQRGVKVQRIFIIGREDPSVPQTQGLRQIAQEIMLLQQSAGIEIFVIRERDVPPPAEDFAVIDRQLVEFGSYIKLGSQNIESQISFDRSDIDSYYRKFNELKAVSLNLNQWLENNR
jgi:hypothetical protein